MRRRTLAIATLVAAISALSVGAPAASHAAIFGIGDEKPGTFKDDNFQSLGVKRTRFFTGWDSIFKEPKAIEAWMDAARAAHTEPLIAFRQSKGDKCPARPCTLPSVAAYTKAFKAFKAKYPSVRLYQPWNEANSATEPTGKKPKRAAEYYNAVKANCRGCQVTAADVLDIKNQRKWLTTFLETAKGTPKLWGLHNYGDVNRHRTVGIKTLEAVVKGKIWLTETGGITSFTTTDGRKALPFSESRSLKATNFLLKTAKRDKRIKRVYLYQWRGQVGDRFDAGIVRPDASTRPIFDVLKKNKSLFR